jgi:hypothetical protein
VRDLAPARGIGFEKRIDLLDGKVWNVKASRLGALDEFRRQDCLANDFTEPVD